MGKRGAIAFTPDWEEFGKLCGIQCTLSEIAAYYDVSEDTIERAVKRTHKLKFAEYFKQKRKKGFVSLRRTMWQLALKGDKTMLIWLSKQHLKFSEKMTVKDPKPQTPPTSPAVENNEQLKRLETLLLEIKAPENKDREAKMLEVAKRLGIEK